MEDLDKIRKELEETRGYNTYQWLADKIGLKRQTLYQFMNGTNPKIETYFLLKKYLEKAA